MAVFVTRDIFLKGTSLVFLVAFTSFYLQIPGLFGNEGILPARIHLRSTAATLDGRMRDLPTLVWLAPYLGLNIEYMLDVIALCGILTSLICFVSTRMCISLNFLNMWGLYYSLYAVGGTFMWYQWDILLLETGFLCILIAPLYRNQKDDKSGSPREDLKMWLVRWLLFRLMFASGVVKLSSNCPTWWGLSALEVHFESQCIPTPVSWYAHHLPRWFLKLSTVATYVIEIGVPALFFFPLRSVKITAFALQVFLQLCIIVTGNYNYFNFLTIFLCFSLLDDEFFGFDEGVKKVHWFVSLLGKFTNIAVYSAIISLTIMLFGIQYSPKHVLEMGIVFSKQQFHQTLSKALPIIIYCGLISLIGNIMKAIALTILDSKRGIASKIHSMLSTLLLSVAALMIFSLSVVPLSTLHPSANLTVTPELQIWHTRIGHLHITNSYGLFRRMTGVGGRPEVVIEGSNNLNGPWYEYNFRYKVGNVNKTLPFVAPHQPRLDWQMWFAALGTYHQNPWLLSLTYRLLSAQPEVLQLLDNTGSPFHQKAPKYIRAQLYHYHYTPWTKRNSNTWWTRERVSEYFPAFTLENKALIEYLQNYKILPDKEMYPATVQESVKNILDTVRNIVSQFDPALLIWSLLMTALVIRYSQFKRNN